MADNGKFSSVRKSFTFTWILENFEYCGQRDKLLSPAFIVDTMEKTKWRLFINPRPLDQSESWISVYLSREEDSKGPLTIEVDFEIAILASDSSVLTSNSSNGISFPKKESSGFLKFIERKTIYDRKSIFLPQGALTVQCKLGKPAADIERNGHCLARTRFGVEKKSFLWKIRNFSILYYDQDAAYRLKSTSDDKTVMSMKLFVRSDGNANTIHIRFINMNQNIEFVKFKSSLINSRGDFMSCGKYEICFLPTVLKEECKLLLSKDQLIENSSLYLPKDILTLFCNVSFSTGVVFEGVEDTFYECPGFTIPNMKTTTNKTSNLKLDLGSMLEDNIKCNVKLCVESEIFPAHWFILIARSPVFRAMYKSDMKEKTKDQIHIEDLRPNTVRQMLRYMYTDSLATLDCKTAADLLVAAEKYQIMSLKDLCSAYLNSIINCTNVCELLILADLHQVKELKLSAQRYITLNDKIVFNSSEWKLLMEANLQLAAETMLLKYK